MKSSGSTSDWRPRPCVLLRRPEGKSLECKRDASSPAGILRTVVAVQVFPSATRPHHLTNAGPSTGTYVRVGSTNRRADDALIAEMRRFARGESFDETARGGEPRPASVRPDHGLSAENRSSGGGTLSLGFMAAQSNAHSGGTPQGLASRPRTAQVRVMTSNALLEQILGLPPAERLQLLEDVWASLAKSEASVPVPAWHREELDRRLASVAEEPSLSWDEVQRRARPQR